MARQVKRYGWVLGLSVAIAAATLSVLWPGAKSEAAFGDGSVRVPSNGPIALAPGDEAATRLLLRAVQRAMARVTILDEEGNALLTEKYENPNPSQGTAGSFFDVFFDITVTDTEIIFADGSVREVIGEPRDGEAVIAILIGLRLPAVQNVRQTEFRSYLATTQIGLINPPEPESIAFPQQVLLLPFIDMGMQPPPEPD